MDRALAIATSLVLLAACGTATASQDNALRQGTLSYRFEITADSLPPHANEWINYRITVQDRKTNQPVQNGEGQIYAELHPKSRPYTWDGFVYGPEVGTYHARLRFVIAGDNGSPWQMGLRFRRDSLAPLEVIDWEQQVLPERDNVKPPS